MKPCLRCGEPTEASYCPAHQPAEDRGTSTERGYDNTWRKLSERARRLQPFCSDCFTTSDLTTDHSATAWRRRAAGKSIRLRDVEVVCRSCNGKRGKQRPDDLGGSPSGMASRPGGKAQTELRMVLTPGELAGGDL